MSRVANYELRSRIFQLEDTAGIYKLYRLYRRVEYCKLYGISAPPEYLPEFHDDEFAMAKSFYPSEWEECERIYKSDKARSYRLKIKMRYMLTVSKCYFLRLSFTDSVLQSTTPQTRRKYVTRFLTSLNCAYIANIDFGSNDVYIDDKGVERVGTAREHYHALVSVKLPKSKLSEWILNYGTLFAEPVRCSLTSTVRLSKYVSKLCNHAVKVTAKRGALLFSRKYKLPSTKTEFNNLVAPILAKGYVLGIRYDTNKTRFRSFKVTNTMSNKLVARCCMCGSIIPVLPSDMPSHTLTVTKGQKVKKYYFCSDCKEIYKVKTDC